MFSEFTEWLKKLWKPIAGFVGAAVVIYQFYQLWLDQTQAISWIVAGLGLAVLIALLVYVGFSRKESVVQPGAKQARYPKWHQSARVVLGIVVVLTLLGGVLLFQQGAKQRESLEGNFVVLVANFDGPTPENYRITEIALLQLRDSLSEYEDTLIVALDAAITEQTGASAARTIGENHAADLVLWGWYGVTDSYVNLTLHVENLGGPEILPLETGEVVVMHGTLAEIDSFEIQGELSTVIRTLTLFVSGLGRYEARDYSECIDRLSRALEDTIVNEDLVSKVVLFIYLGNCHLQIGNYTMALDNYNKGVASDPTNVKAYYGRGLANYYLGEYGAAVEDNNQAIEIDGQYADAYVNRGLAFTRLGDQEQAFANYAQAIAIDPKNYKAYYNRGNLHYRLRDYSLANEDYSTSIEINPTNAKAHYGRGLANYYLGEYRQAVNDNSRAIEIDGQYADAYVNRGIVQRRLGERDRAIEDYSRALEIDPLNDKAYYNRGGVYMALGETQQAIADFHKLLEISENEDLRTRAEDQLKKLGENSQ